MNAIYANPFRYGQRDYARSSAPKKVYGKAALFYVMHLYYVANKIPLGDNCKTPEEIEKNLEQRYQNTFTVIRTFVEAQILAGTSEAPIWSDFNKRTRDAYSLIVEDFVERTLGAERDGLPLFCTDQHYAVNYFLTAILRNSQARGTNNRVPSVPVSFIFIKYFFY